MIYDYLFILFTDIIVKMVEYPAYNVENYLKIKKD